MTDTSNASGTLTRTTKQSDTAHPHYFTSFQNYCCGPKTNTSSSSSSSASTSKDLLPIPEQFKLKGDEILSIINRTLIERLHDVTQYTSVLPYEFFEQEQVGGDIQRYLVDRTMFKLMNDARVINWMASLKKLYPVRTSGNGNCLLHAVLIAMVGIHDFNLYLRDRLLQFMDKNKELLKGSWRNERLKTDKSYGIQTEDSKLDNEWEELCDLVRYENSEDGQTASSLQFLEGVHIFSISNMLARPIIILSEDVVRNKHGEAISYNDLFGIYLPILVRPQDCSPLPIVLAYDQSHFCPLQTSDEDTKISSDNFLPLYQSIEHTRNQNLLPIRFLGNDVNQEQTTKLLQTYLRIRKLSAPVDANSPSIPIICAELSNKHISRKDNFFLLYYQYVTDFVETQKRKVQEEDEDKRRRDQDYFSSNHLQYDNTTRPLQKRNTSSSPPPPPYSSISLRSSDNKNNPIFERRSSYEKAVINGTSHVPLNTSNRPVNQHLDPHLSQQPPNYARATTQRDIHSNDNYINTRQPPLSNWDDNINNLNSNDLMYNGKTMNTSSTTSRGSDSKLKQDQQQKTVRLPVQFVKTNSPSNNPNLIDFDKATERIRPCIVCKLYFEDLLSTGLCSNCDYNRRNPPLPPRYVSVNRYPPIAIQSPPYKNSDFLTPFSPSPSPRTRVPQKVVCPHCKNLNMINGLRTGVDFSCSVCQTLLRPARYY